MAVVTAGQTVKGLGITKRSIWLNCVAVPFILHLESQSVPRSKHSVSVLKTSQLMLYREIIAVCPEIHIKRVT